MHRQLKWALLAGLASAAIVGATLALLLALALGGEITLPAAAAAAGAMVLLGQRLAYGGFSAETLLESAMFVEDYFAFLALGPDGALSEAPPALTAVGPVAPRRSGSRIPAGTRPPPRASRSASSPARSSRSWGAPASRSAAPRPPA